MNRRLLNFLLILTSLFGYLEWGADNRMFLFQMEYEILTKLFSNPDSVMHPFVVLPLLGQLILMVTLFQRTPGKILTFIGMGCIGLLLGFMFVIGIIGMSIKIFLSTVPFMVTATLVVMSLRHPPPNPSKEGG